MKTRIVQIEKDFNSALEKATDLKTLEQIRNSFFGRNSELNQILKSLNKLSIDEKKALGGLANSTKNQMIENFEKKWNHYHHLQNQAQLLAEKIDLSLPGTKLQFGNLHPINLIVRELNQIFSELGFEIVPGIEIESDLFNFQKLNLPLNHPARAMQDTFYLSSDTVLRTHSTNMTARLLTDWSKVPKKNRKSHLAVVSTGNVYRRDTDDATHSHQFTQVDGFVIGPYVSFANLKWLLEYVMKRLFGDEVLIRLRPSYFPFTEPSVEVDISCFKCHRNGCDLCKQSGWIEVLGAGMINSTVLKLNGLDPEVIFGFAFGIGVERIAMLKYDIPDIRAFYENNLDFLMQFISFN